MALDRLGVAIHEASHAVAALAVGRRVFKIELNFDNVGGEQGVTYSGFLDMEEMAKAEPTEMQSSLNVMITVIAGHLGGEKHQNFPLSMYDTGSSQDMLNLVQFAFNSGGHSVGTAISLLAEAETQARKILNERWPLVEAIAKLLCERNTLQEQDVMEVVSHAQNTD